MSPGKTNDSMTGTNVPDLRLAPKLERVVIDTNLKRFELIKPSSNASAEDASNSKPFILHKPQVESSLEDLFEHIKKIKLHRRKSAP
jgi:hypothetical protein